jgi:hypothetical protein
VPGAPLQQAVREPTGGRAEIERMHSPHVKRESLERIRELDPATRGEDARRRHLDLDILRNELSRFLGALPLGKQQHLARQHRRRSP